MEQNEISMAMDVKLDINERKVDFCHLRSWTKCYVKIEAIKCFPCYVKITFTRSTDEDGKNMVVKINIPGLNVEMATSRTKQHSYGLFWKNNRKKCSIFFALDSQISCDRHMKWMKKSIKNLELHRREILETRRASRNSQMDDSIDSINFNNTQTIRDINDILGPLPELPDSAVNWSRRISGFSGIYEEILDGDNGHKNVTRRASRASIASGIYEVMQPPLNVINEVSFQALQESPPPLPPRRRTSTQGEFHRSYTNPESESFKKRSCGFFDSVFWRYKRSDSCGSEYKPKNFKPLDGNQSTDDGVVLGFYDKDNKRNSLSTPDLFQFTHYENHPKNSILEQINKITKINGSLCLNNTFTIENSLSENIGTSFSLSCDQAIGQNGGEDVKYSSSRKIQSARIIEDVSGYCRMVPIFPAKSLNSTEMLPEFSALKSTNHYATPIRTKPINDGELSNTISTAFLQNDETGENDICDSIKNLIVLSNNDSNKSIAVIDIKNTVVKIDGTNENNLKCKSEAQYISEDKPNISNASIIEQSILCKSPYTSTMIDDKYPSYYPNLTNSIDKTTKKQRKIATDSVIQRAENVYITTPHKPRSNKRSHSQDIKFMNKNDITDTIEVPDNKTINQSPNLPCFGNSVDILTKTTSDLSPSINGQFQTSPRLYQKYATLARITPNRYVDKSASKKVELSSSIKRFASLPRFRKIDFSPLKLKLNSVLQRQNSDI